MRLILLNEDNFKIMHIGKTNSSHPYIIKMTGDHNIFLQITEVEKYLGIQLSLDMKSENQVVYASNKAYKIFGILKRTFTYSTSTWQNYCTILLYART